MLGKLIKDELKSYRFSFGIIFLTGTIFTIFMKIVCMLPYQGEVRDMVQILVSYGWYFIIMLISVAAQVLVIIRFYSTMVGDRGYLTWTLPAASSTHLWAKLIGGMLWRLLAVIVTIVLFVIYCIGNYWGFMEEITADVIWREMTAELMDVFRPEYLVPILLMVLAAIVWTAFAQLLIYMCIAVGQLFGKWRILASFGCYFLVMILMQILSVMGVVILSVGSAFNDIDVSLNIDGVWGVSGVAAVVLLLGVGVNAILFAVTNHIFKNHLNLE